MLGCCGQKKAWTLLEKGGRVVERLAASLLLLLLPGFTGGGVGGASGWIFCWQDSPRTVQWREWQRLCALPWATVSHLEFSFNSRLAAVSSRICYPQVRQWPLLGLPVSYGTKSVVKNSPFFLVEQCLIETVLLKSIFGTEVVRARLFLFPDARCEKRCLLA